MKWGGRTQISRENALGRENKSRDSETGVKLACLENLARTPGGWNWMSRGEMAEAGPGQQEGPGRGGFGSYHTSSFMI